MPWTRRQVKYLLSKGSPLTAEQQNKMKSELHSDPAMGHATKGSSALKKESPDQIIATSHTFDHRRPKRKVVTRHIRGKF